VILGISLKIEKLSPGQIIMYIHISGWYTFDYWTVSSLIVTGRHRWHSQRTWSWFWRRLSQSVWWSCTTAIAPPVCLQILCCTILARKEPISWISCTIARCHSIAAFRFLWVGHSTPSFIFCQTLVGGCFIRYCVSTIAVHENPPLATFAISKARRMLDHSCCMQPPGLPIVADRLKTYKKLFAASTIEIWLLPLQLTVP